MRGGGLSEASYSLPENFWGALVLDEKPGTDEQYSWAICCRLLAAVALTHGVRGAVSGEFRKLPNGSSTRFRQAENWYLPFLEHSRTVLIVADVQDQSFNATLQLLGETTPGKFLSAKEDYRLLALETAADARGGSAVPLQFAHTWMAVERLLPFRHETSVQVAIALSALSPVAERASYFDRIKKSYALRSAVAHGYSFKRDTEMYSELAWIAGIFRRLFRVSLSTPGADELREQMVEHVLSGRPQAFDDPSSGA